MPRILVTGGSGYLGFHIAKTLAESGRHEVIIFDLVDPPISSVVSMKYIRGDVCDVEMMRRALVGVNAVVHSAGFGLSGATNLPAFDSITQNVNVGGTRNVLAGCRAAGVKALVFTSSTNVLFTGEREIINASEEEEEDERNMSYIDCYSETKHTAEKLVMAASSNQLRCCSLRLGGIYGPGEKMMMPKSIRCIQSGLLDLVSFSSDSLRIDFLHVDNAVQAHIKAMNMLLSDDTAVNGQVFYITDGDPKSLNSILEPLYSSFRGGGGGGERKKLNPLVTFHPKLLLFVANCFFWLSRLIGARFHTMPFWGLTPMEIRKMTVSHYFCIDKAKTVLNYLPVMTNEERWSEILASYSDLETAADDDNTSNRPFRDIASIISFAWYISASFCCVILAAFSLL